MGEPTYQRTTSGRLLGEVRGWPRAAAGVALPLRQAGAERAEDRLGNQAADVATVLGDLLDQARAEERVERVGRHEQRLDLGQAVVHLRLLHLVLEVADGAEPLDDRVDPVRHAEVHRQSVELLDPDVAVALSDLAEHLGPLVGGEHRLLGDVDENGHDHLVVDAGRPADDVEGAIGYRVERTRAYHSLHAVSLLMRHGGRIKLSTATRNRCGPLPSRCRTSHTRRSPHRTFATYWAESRGASLAGRTWSPARSRPARRRPASRLPGGLAPWSRHRP